MKNKTLLDCIECFIAGDWGEADAFDDSVEVNCIRGADFPDISSGIIAAPVRFISKTAFENKQLPRNCIVIEKSGGSPTQSTGRVVFIDDSIINMSDYPLICSNFCAAFTIKQQWYPSYIFWFITMIYNAGVFFNYEGKTTGIKNLQLEDAFSSIRLPDLNYDEQKRIADILDTIANKTRNNRSVSSTIDAMLKLLYEYWFIQFDFPDESGKPYKSSGGKMVWNDELKREIPVGWTVSHLGKECEILLGGTPDTNKDEYWGGDIPWLNSGEVALSPVLSAEKTITKEGMNNSTTAFAEAGAVVMSITRYIRPSILGIDACFNQSVVAVKPTKMFHTSYLYPLMKSNVDRYMKLRTGAQQPHINKGIVENTLLLCPSETVLNEYYRIVEDLYAQQMNVSKETQQLASLRDFLLPMLMNGQVKVGA